MDSKNSPIKKQKLPMIDHGIDIIGDEWDEEEEWANNEVNADALQNKEDWKSNTRYDTIQIIPIVQIGL